MIVGEAVSHRIAECLTSSHSLPNHLALAGVRLLGQAVVSQESCTSAKRRWKRPSKCRMQKSTEAATYNCWH